MLFKNISESNFNSGSFFNFAPNSQLLVYFGNISNLFVFAQDFKPGNQSHICSRKCNVLYNTSECAAIDVFYNNFLL